MFSSTANRPNKTPGKTGYLGSFSAKSTGNSPGNIPMDEVVNLFKTHVLMQQ